MVKVFEIVLDPPASPSGYLSGSTLSGTVVVETGEPKSYKQIQVAISGTGKVEWTVGGGEDSEIHRAREEYVKESVTLWTSSSVEGGEDGMFSAGRHEFPFTFSLPASCPSSYETKRVSSAKAWVRYVVAGRIGTAGALKADHTVEVPVTVRKQVSVNQASFLEPVKRWTQESVGCLCCVSAPVIMTVELPRSGFALGERIPLTVNLENGSSRNIHVMAVLSKKTTYKADGNVLRRPPLGILRERSMQFRARSTGEWTPQALIVPDTQMTMVTPGGMISISYELSVEVGLLLGQRMAITVPLTIGDAIPSQVQEAISNGSSDITVAIAGRTIVPESYQPWET